MSEDRTREPNDLQKAHAAIADALGTIEGLAVYTEADKVLSPPCLAIGLPNVEWNGNTTDPTDAVFTVGLIASAQRLESLHNTLMEYLPDVSEALERISPNAEIRRASPGTWPNSGVDLPAYLIEIEVALPWR